MGTGADDDGGRRILYLSHATTQVYDIIREQVPEGYRLLTLERDDDAERRRLIARCEAIIVAATPLTRAVIEAAPDLRLVHHQGVGYHDTVDTRALAERGVRLALTPAGTTVGVAEHTVLLILAVLRRLPFADAELRLGHWHVNSLRPQSRELAGLTVGYVGMGRIGQAVAARLRVFDTDGVDCDDQAPLAADREGELGLRRLSFDELLACSQVVSLHLPGTAATRHLVDAAAIARMRPGAVLINTARGSIVDQDALFDALRRGHLGGAGLDVFEHEPPDASHPLFAMSNVVVTPHISAGTRDALSTKMRSLFANVQRFFGDGVLNDEVELQ